MRSKFDTDDEASDEEKPDKPISKGYSGYHEALSGDELSGGSGQEEEEQEENKSGELVFNVV